jgi:hypothetical protein
MFTRLKKVDWKLNPFLIEKMVLGSQVQID